LKLPDRYTEADVDLDSGGMSSTMVCMDGHLDRLVVVKQLAEGVDPRRILDELAALQAIRSKHVVQIYDVIRDVGGNVAAIIEEYLPGDDLTQVAPPTTPLEFLKVAYPIAEGIADIHRHGRVHRDIKRQNMKFDAEGCLKIFDFGLARDAGVNASTKGLLGTRGYMAPELFQGDEDGRVSFTPAVDTFAFAATLLVMVLGKPPACLSAQPPELPSDEADFASVPFTLPDEISDMLNRCLDSNPANRPAMGDVANVFALHLLRDEHRALLVSGNNTYWIDRAKPKVRIAVSGRGTLSITYDGLRFVVSEISGDVAINNLAISNGDCLPGSCVIVLGAAALGTRRTMITVDVSHPEVVL
jgi:serine/threonine protein kinase